MYQKQVGKKHYQFSSYINKNRWLSIWHQLDEVLSLCPSSVLEIGPGPGALKVLLRHFGIKVETADIDPDLDPDHLLSATDLLFADNSYDCVCAFQMLEHLPYSQAILAFKEIVRVSKSHIVISLPDAKVIWTYSVHIPIFGQKTFHILRPRLRNKVHQYDGEHYWEINKREYPLQKVVNDFSRLKVKLINTYRVKEYPVHRFFIYSKTHTN